MSDCQNLPNRKSLPHNIPDWVRSNEFVYFITICAKDRNVNSFCNENIASLMKESILFYQKQGKWNVHLFLLMPDHIHGLFTFSVESGIKKTVSNWKRFIAANSEIKWQRDFFEHRVRLEENLQEKAEYIANNPVRGGLVKQKQDWPYIWRYV